MTIKEICEKYGIGQTALARRFNIPLRTVQHWYAESRTPPEYLPQMIIELLEHDKASVLTEVYESSYTANK